MSETSFNLIQKVFPWMSRNVEVDPENLKIRVFYKTLFKHQAFSVDLYEVNENPVRVSKKSVSWFVFSVFLSLYTFIAGVGLLTQPVPSVFAMSMMILFFAISAVLSWNKYCEESQDLLVYTSRFHSSEYALFSLIADGKNKDEYSQFVSRLGEILTSLRKGRDLRVMIEQTPGKILLEEFRTSYIEELLSRDVDLMHFLDGLQEQFTSRHTTLIAKKYLN